MALSGPAECRYPLDGPASVIELSDGRKLGYATYGDPNGVPFVYCAGFPSSSKEGAGLHPEALKVGARIISVDRPGYGSSSPHKERTLFSHAQDVEALTNHLELQRYGVLGISGGGPYALACARSLPADKLRAVAIVCGLGSPDMTYAGMNWTSWLGWTYGQRWFPWLCRWWTGFDPGARLDLSEEERVSRMRKNFEKGKAKMDPKDAAMFGDQDFMWMHIRRSTEVFKQGMDGFSNDFRVLNSDFGFKIEDIRKDLPVLMWHGRYVRSCRYTRPVCWRHISIDHS